MARGLVGPVVVELVILEGLLGLVRLIDRGLSVGGLGGLMGLDLLGLLVGEAVGVEAVGLGVRLGGLGCGVSCWAGASAAMAEVACDSAPDGVVAAGAGDGTTGPAACKTAVGLEAEIAGATWSAGASQLRSSGPSSGPYGIAPMAIRRNSH